MRFFSIIFLFVFTIIISGCTSSPISQEKQTTNNLAVLCKVWGFLKYNHPEIGESNIDWDSVLLNNIDHVLKLKNKDSIKEFYDGFIPGASDTLCANTLGGGDSITLDNKSIAWIEDMTVFSSNSIEKLKRIYKNNCPFDNKYVSKNQWVKNPIFDQDTSYNNIIFPSLNIRLLSLFRYWNIINYYYPYKYLIDIHWEEALELLIPVFINASDTLKYHLAVCKLTAMINDNHGYTSSIVINNFWGNNFLPTRFALCEEKTIITEIYSDSLAQINNLKLGDVIIEIEGKSIEEIRDSLSQYFSGSNNISIQHTISYYLSRSSNNNMQLLVERNDSLMPIISKTYPRKIISAERKKNKLINPIKNINNGITYIDLSKLTYDNADSIITQFLDSQVLIFDLRKNCQFIIHNICEILFPNTFTFYAVTTPLYQKPGLFCYTMGDETGPKENNINYFKGKIIILIGEGTQSIGEFTTMALIMHDNVTLIGCPTAGADGNISTITLPGNIKTFISGIGIYWPNGELTQRVGISPDITVYQQIQSVKTHKDDVLEAAIKYSKTLTE